jgi:uncharacterized membrane protein
MIAAGTAAAQTYTATSLTPAGSSYHFANLIGLNNQGQVLGDTCLNGTGCTGVDRFPAVWSNGVITPLPIPSGYDYFADPFWYAINDSGTVVGTMQVGGTNTSHVVVWENGVPTVLPDAPIPGACTGSGCTCSPDPSSTNYSVGSTSFGLNTAGNIVGSSTYPPYVAGGQTCSGYWVYDGATFRLLPVAIPAECTSPPLPPGYAPGVAVALGAAINDADQVVQTLDNFFCGPPYITPGFPAADPFFIQTNGNYSFLPLGAVAGAVGLAINNLGVVLGTNGGFDSFGQIVIWDASGLQVVGEGTYATLNNLDEVLYLSGNPGGPNQVAIWYRGVSTPIQFPSGLFPPDDNITPSSINDAGQFTVEDGVNFYLMTPSRPCAQNVTSEVQVTHGTFTYVPTTGRFTQTVTLTNTGGSSIPGPISIALDNLPASASLYGISGATLCDPPKGSPYIYFAAGPLASQASVTGTLQFIDTAHTAAPYEVRVLAGPGER